jgi:hypothetical protein
MAADGDPHDLRQRLESAIGDLFPQHHAAPPSGAAEYPESLYRAVRHFL